MKSRLFALARIVISLALIGIFFYIGRDTLHKALDAIKGIKTPLLIASYAIFIIGVGIVATRLKILLGAQGLLLRYSDVLYLTFIGYFFNHFLPTAVGGDIVKAYYTCKKTEDNLKSVICVFMDRFLGLFSLFILAGISLIFGHALIEQDYLVWVVIGTLLTMLLIFMLFFNQRFAALFSPLARLSIFSKIEQKIKEIYSAINSFRDKKGRIFQAIAISIVAQMMVFSILCLLSNSLGAPISIKLVFLFMPIVSIISMLPSIGGLGIRENAVYLLLGPYVGYENSFILSLLYLSVFLVVGFIGGVCYLFRREKGGTRCQKS
jgi:uncharacterized protein (TIRG00374 family)